MTDAPTPLFVRLPAEATRSLERAVAATGKSKRQVVEEAVRAHLPESGMVVGRAELREDPPEVLTLEEAAALLRVDPGAMTEAVERGELPARRIGGQWRFSRTALLAWLGSATVSSS